GTVLIDAERPARDAVTGWLAKVAPLSGCEVTDETERWTVTGLRGPKAVDHIPPDAIAAAVDWGLPGYDVITLSAFEINAVSMTASEYDAARIATGRPR